MRVRIAVAVMAALLALYLVFAIRYGLVLLGVGTPVAIGLGVGMLVLPLLALGLTAAELVFAVRAEALGRRLEAEGGLPTEQLPLTASGRIERGAADEVFPTYRAAVEADPENWRPWFRLALAYDASGDRRRARWATRTAIRLSRARVE
ncbi:tetratricopeptide repeat protein [Pseudolysinimonas sp.]|uniref:tetratricopeptide repeat protein n=1 Tax=Pseudolysinimonas sp. TaxID=2680009 RepID=UPI003F7EAF47